MHTTLFLCAAISISNAEVSAKYFKLTVLRSYGFLPRPGCLELGTPPPPLAIFGCLNCRQALHCTTMEKEIFIRTSATSSIEEYGGGKYDENDWLMYSRDFFS